MRTIFITCLIIFPFIHSKAQTYSLDPSNTIITVAPYEELSIFDIYQINETDSNIVFGWERISVNLPSGWDYSLCDYPSCYTGIPNSGTMDSVGGGYMGFLGLNINPFSIPGQGIVKIYVFDSNFPNDGDTLTWIVNSSPVSVEENSISSISVFPNPVKNILTVEVESGEDTETEWRILSMDGKMVMTGNFNLNSNIDVESFPSGVYILHVVGIRKSFTTKFTKTE